MNRVKAAWLTVRDSLWFLPALLTTAAAGLAFFMVEFDRRLADALDELPWFVFEAGADGAREVLGTIAGSIITVTGVVFSITIVALQLASSQFTPRVLRNFIGDRANQLVLGVFIGTFTYALLVLRTVRADEDAAGFVPSVSITVAVLLALVSIGFLIFFVNHIARSIQAEVIIERVTADTLAAVDRLFPEELGHPAGPDTEERLEPPAGEAAVCRASSGGYIQAVDEDALLEAAERGGLTIRLEHEIGAFVLPREPLASAWPADAAEDSLEQLRAAFVVGLERTPHQDVERGVIELTDIGIRALSPGVNDPTTAMVCIDRLSQVLAALGSRRYPEPVRVGSKAGVRVIVQHGTFDQAVRLAFAQLRHHGAGDPAVAIRLVTALGRVMERVPASRRQALAVEVEETVAQARRNIASARDVERIAQAGQRALQL